MKIYLLGFLVGLFGCSADTGDVRIVERDQRYCSPEHEVDLRQYIQDCINSTEKKDEETMVHVIHRCEYRAKKNICPVVTMIVTEQCTDCYWSAINVKRKPQIDQLQSTINEE